MEGPLHLGEQVVVELDVRVVAAEVGAVVAEVDVEEDLALAVGCSPMHLCSY